MTLSLSSSSSSSSPLSEDTQMAHSQGHICQCLSHIRRASPFTIAGRRVRTGRDFADGVLSLSRGLSHLGIRPGDVVAIAALNSDFYMEWLLAITCVGAIAAPLNYRWSFEEAKSAMEVVTPVMLVVDESCRSWALALQNCNVVRSLRLYAFIGDSSFHGLNGSGEFLTTESLRMPAPGLIVHEPIYTPKGIALICFTSGTTGRPKGVAISHTALIVQALAKIAVVGYGESDVYLHTAPLCHIGGISSCIAMLFTAACHVFMPKFDAKSSFLAIQENQVTSLIVVPAMLSDLISFARNANKMVTGVTVRKILNGGGGLSSTLINLATHIFPHTKIFSAYGLTETCSSLTFMTLNDPTLEESGISQHSNHKMTGVLVGKPAPHVELRIKCDSESSGSPLTGSILTRGLHVMVGYFQKMDVKMEFVGKGWFDTGDIGWIDGNGGLWLVGRDKDRIKSGGENVYPEEVEAVLSQHPGILHVVVVGIPDMRLGEKLVACVFIRTDWKWVDKKIHHFQEAKELSSEILHTYCRQKNLTGFKIPKIFIPWRTPFPLTTTGKLKREDVKAEVISCMKLTSSL